MMSDFVTAVQSSPEDGWLNKVNVAMSRIQKLLLFSRE